MPYWKLLTCTEMLEREKEVGAVFFYFRKAVHHHSLLEKLEN